jgi:hypothetical protein
MKRTLGSALAALALIATAATTASAAAGHGSARVINDPDSTCVLLVVDSAGSVSTVAPGEDNRDVYGFTPQEGCTAVTSSGDQYPSGTWWYGLNANYKLTVDPT